MASRAPGSAWDRFRHLHRNEQVVALYLRLLKPLLDWFTPARRRLLLGIASLYVAYSRPWGDLRKIKAIFGEPADNWTRAAVVMLLFAFVLLCYLAARKFAALPGWVRKHPQICLHAVFWVLLIALWRATPGNRHVQMILAGCALFLPFLLWRLGYLLMTAQRGRLQGTRFTDHLMYIYPLWRGTETPFGKGWDYLSSNEAKDSEALARSQLAGIKLMILGMTWSVCEKLMDGLVYGHDNAYRQALGGVSLFLPNLPEILASPHAHPRWQGWLSLYLNLFHETLNRAAYGHIVIGWLRLFGFNVFRNTYKPLLATTIIDFWNRYFYYFKELLVNFFFYPAFTRYFKKSPQTRLFFAVLMSAFVGNVYYHCIGMNIEIVSADFATLWSTMQSRILYCALLTIGIYVSMRREGSRVRSKGARPWARVAWSIFLVWTFFAVINIWSHGTVPFGQRLMFVKSLIGF